MSEFKKRVVERYVELNNETAEPTSCFVVIQIGVKT